MKYGNPYAVLPSAALFGLMAAVLWFTVGSIRTEDTIEWIECIETEENAKSEDMKIQSEDKNWLQDIRKAFYTFVLSVSVFITQN